MKQFNEGEHFYYDPDGLMVLTEKYHRERGYCCGNGCRHCPYDYEIISEPRRSQLIEQRKTNGNTPEKK